MKTYSYELGELESFEKKRENMGDQNEEKVSIKYQFFWIMMGFVIVALAFYIFKEIQVN